MISTALVSGFDFNNLRRSSGLAAVPGGKLNTLTFAPNLFAISPKRSPKLPIVTHITLSFGESVFETVASIAPVPEEVRM